MSFIKKDIFLKACLDETQLVAFDNLQNRLSPEFLSWVNAQYDLIEKTPYWDSAIAEVFKNSQFVDGLFCEFGVCTGRSTNLIAKNINPREIYGFDSFQGLPDDWVIGDITVPKGFLAIDSTQLKFEDNVRLVKGYFNQSLPEFVKTKKDPVAFMHIDCDTYESTVDIFNYTADRFRVDTVIVFDEILGDMGTENELKALWELLKKTNIKFEWIGYGGHCWTAETQARFHKIKKNDFWYSLKFAFVNFRSVVGFLRNKKKVENAPSAAAIRITSIG